MGVDLSKFNHSKSQCERVSHFSSCKFSTPAKKSSSSKSEPSGADGERGNGSKMCPLRLILIFLSATLAGFFVLKSFNSRPADHHPSDDDDVDTVADPSVDSYSSKVCSAFWTCVDMASGRYLWKHLSASSAKSSTD